MHEILGATDYAPPVFGNQAPDSGNSELIAIAGDEEQKEKWMEPLLAGESSQRLLDDRAGHRLRPHASSRPRPCRDGDEWVINGHKWFSRNADNARLPHRDGVTDPDAAPPPADVDDHRPHRLAGHRVVRDIGVDERPRSSTSRDPHPLRSHLPRRPRPRREPARRARRRLRARPGAPRARAHPPRDALARRLPTRLRHAVRARRVASRCTAAPSPRSRRSRTGSPTRAAEIEAARLMTLHAAWKIDQVGAKRARASRSR